MPALLRDEVCGYMFSAEWINTLASNPLLSEEEQAAATGNQAEPVGLGPFQYVSYTPGNGNSFVAERNPTYWRGDGNGSNELATIELESGNVVSGSDLINVTLTDFDDTNGGTIMITPLGSNGTPADRSSVLEDLRIDTGFANPESAEFVFNTPIVNRTGGGLPVFRLRRPRRLQHHNAQRHQHQCRIK